jgi:pimeloyl-ACP methyl ester carboxylesterase
MAWHPGNGAVKPDKQKSEPLMHKPPIKNALAEPSRGLRWRESRALLDFGRMFAPLLLPAGSAKTSNPQTVIILPGFGADDRVMWPLRRYLQKLGHHAEGWGLGFNRAGTNIKHQLHDLSPGWAIEHVSPYRGEGGVPMLCDRMVQRVRERHLEHKSPICLVGWSLGGVVAREVARELPDLISQVITLGTPVKGGPKYTAAAPFFRERGMDLDWIEREVARRDAMPIQVPITAIISRSDAVVNYAATLDHISPNVRHVEIDAAHIGMCVNPSVWRAIAQAMTLNAGKRSD